MRKAAIAPISTRRGGLAILGGVNAEKGNRSTGWLNACLALTERFALHPTHDTTTTTRI